ncbi:hypothetical protein LK07_32235 [Streptomyces pluripotens]|uniref:Uncharacterized protein n=1 Tax=Streptomyces pluripotens TaxID=1355015 RepID=A0A221P7Z5_9ACTN|nr:MULTISPECIES: hypothetical protein [Streptomyces]ARP73668.1 hypothetical protein LK06_031035 [Streptomyces pluripotens]ASN27915.1 hypothetical protein LK07_32235 [Streptomyces pluripotens]KIE24372.1 hypothetical protein LK08_25215 [Streptomyces sp. MUSC 125]MCH0559480.1 hypothetical protein [Streptomyces sp. MUM 16J]
MKRTFRTTVLTVGALIAAFGLQAGPAHADSTTPRIDLRVLVVSDGGPATDAIAAELDTAGTPYTKVDLTAPGRPTIDAAFLADTVDGRPRARFQAVVLPDDNPFAAGSSEMAALDDYEQTYAIPQVDAYTYARPEVGLQYAASSGYSGSLDGAKAQVTAAGLAGPFGYLAGPVPFENNSSSVDESYGYLSAPVAGADFTPYVQAPIPGTSEEGSLVGEYRHDGRRELVVTFVYNQYQEQFRLLARGIVEWMTDGVHLGASHNYFAVHVDDVLAADDRWDTELNCTPGDVDCTNDAGTPSPIRMTAADVDYATAWQNSHRFTFDLVYNGSGSVDQREDNNGVDHLADKLIADRDQFRWINHTFTHAFLGCEQNTSVVPWTCQTNADGSTKWVDENTINYEIATNRVWGENVGLPLESSELVTGEHSGLRILPQQPEDNPNLAPALAAENIKWLASDNSRDPEQRQVGTATTVARYPMNVFYNAGRTVEEVDEYNWLYTSRAQGGSGICEDHPDTTTCMSTPLDTSTGYTDYIVPLETRIDLGHVLSNDPKPHFIHQSNLTEDRIAYPVLDGVLDGYDALFADNTPVVNLRMKDIGIELQRRAAWKNALNAGQITGYRIGNTVTVQAPDATAVTATLPTGTTLGGGAFGGAYAGEVSGWTPSSGSPLVFTLPAPTSVPASTAGSTTRATHPAPRTKVPTGVTRQVPYSPDN